ncbi:MAG: Gfo/Idh/MocA family oxidoreductase [Candidatus Dormibacteraeota bacterium]|nr:Gfo/Idh/MocA family oxidoreductase [Candidatus Dormibacteraeota bacterium]
MTEPLRIAIVGCGGMGRRHLAGLGELARSSARSVRLVCVCDPRPANANHLADEAEAVLGARPRVYASAPEMVAGEPELEAAGCTTDTGSHHLVASELLDLGLHVLCEKPLALTLRGARLIADRARAAGRVLSVAENFRRDPMNRLVRALVQEGAIGTPRLIVEEAIGGRDAILITPWRHRKLSGAMPVDAGVHSADLLQYFFGPVRRASGTVRLFEPRRRKRQTAGPGGFYERWAVDMPDEIEADGEDAIFGVLDFESGAVGQWTDNHAGHGLPVRSRQLFGSTGSIVAPGDRSGGAVRLVLDDGTDVADAGVLDHAPGHRLEPLAAELFGAERPWRYELDFATTDRKLLALEYDELARCVRTGAAPEVGAEVAIRDLALVYALFESSVAGRAVSLQEVISGALDGYQREIDQQLEWAAAPVTRR